MKVIIAGGGTMGREIAKALPDHDVTIIDKNPEACERASKDLGVKSVCGDCRRVYVLKQAGFAKAVAVIAVANSDEVNLLLSMYAAKRGKQVISRVKEPEYMELFEELGITDIISPERSAAMDIAGKIVWKK